MGQVKGRKAKPRKVCVLHMGQFLTEHVAFVRNLLRKPPPFIHIFFNGFTFGRSLSCMSLCKCFYAKTRDVCLPFNLTSQDKQPGQIRNSSLSGQPACTRPCPGLHNGTPSTIPFKSHASPLISHSISTPLISPITLSTANRVHACKRPSCPS